jgi:serine protease Do
MEKVMNRSDSDCRKYKQLTARRLTLLASVGALGATVLLAGPGGRYWQSAVGATPVNAAELGMQRPVGFADIVTKVKPAVISVRVKISGSAEPALLHDNHSDDEEQTPVQPGSPLDRFFRQFGDQPAIRTACATATRHHYGRRVGLFHHRGRLCSDQQSCG